MPFFQSFVEKSMDKFGDNSDYFESIVDEPIVESENYLLDTYSFKTTELAPDTLDNGANLFDFTFDNQSDLTQSDDTTSGRQDSNSSEISNFSTDSMMTLSLPLRISNVSPLSTPISSPLDVGKESQLLGEPLDSDSPFFSDFLSRTPPTQNRLINDNDLILKSPFQLNRSLHMESSDEDGYDDDDSQDDEGNDSFHNKRTRSNRVNKIRKYRKDSITYEHLARLQNANSSKKTADSRLSAAALAEVLNVDSVQEALTREEFITNIFKDELHFPLGYQTWIRDTSKGKRTELIDKLYERTKEVYPSYDKTILESVIRRATYSVMQSRLRRERKQSRLMSKSK